MKNENRRNESVYDDGYFIGFVSERLYDKRKGDRDHLVGLVVEVAPECYNNIKVTNDIEIR